MIDYQEMRESQKRPCITEIDQDRISNLPINVIDQILSGLPIRDGARTSVLSKMWRYKWSELPYLVFDNSLLSRGFEGQLKFPKFASIIDHVLLLHRSTILKFKYSNDLGVGTLENSAMDRWIMHLSKGPIEELAIRNRLDGYCLPPCLFSCQSLTQLSLDCVSTIKLPSTFKGFANLKSLFLRLQKIVDNELEKLIPRCPVLESLTLKVYHYLSHVTVVAPNLLFFSIEGNIGGLNFENTSRLTDVSILLHRNRDPKFQVCTNSSNLHKFCVQLPMIRKLKINSGFLKYLAVGINPSNLPGLCANLDSLTLCMNLNVMGDCVGAFGVLSIFQSLRELSIENNVPSNGEEAFIRVNMWEDHFLSFRFNNLQFVNINGYGITKTTIYDLYFVKFLLSNSPVLERMVIKATDDNDGKRMMMVVKKLLSFKRASAHAQVIFQDNNFSTLF